MSTEEVERRMHVDGLTGFTVDPPRSEDATVGGEIANLQPPHWEKQWGRGCLDTWTTVKTEASINHE